mmetsp:Transcript_14532/g.31479  ORF Transcript_14532/g.31479 Transcript_14532/m.31479 type:complete len:271 (-) Transcript_14532:178-990(-)
MGGEALSHATGLLDQLRRAFAQPDVQRDRCIALVSELKVAMLSFSALPPAIPTQPSAVQRDELLVARETLEFGALLAIKAVDIPAFERHISQLKTYYTDCALKLPESQRQYPLLGLNLLRLLAQNRIAEFHTELELLPTDHQQSNAYIRFPAQLEQHIMEGSYNHVLAAKQGGLYEQEGMYFMDMLVETVREEIADCSEKAYTSISATELQGLLMLASEQELVDYAKEREWVLEGGIVTFGNSDEKPLQLPSQQLISETLAYARELERIV